MQIAPNRAAAYLTAGAALASGLAPVIAQMDVKDTASCLGAGAGVLLVFREWLKGWRNHEAKQAEIWPGSVEPPR